MKNKLITRLLCTFLPMSQLITSCSHPPTMAIERKIARVEKIATGFSATPMALTGKLKDINFVRLKTSDQASKKIDKVIGGRNTFYLLNSSERKLLIFSGQGEQLTTLKNCDAFDLTNKNELYAYDRRLGLITEYSETGEMINSIKIGFRGLEFAKLNDSLFVFNTCGLITDDKSSSKFHLAFVNIDGKLETYGLPIDENFKGINYCASNRFTRNKSQIFFMSDFTNMLYRILPASIIPETGFNFDKYTLSKKEVGRIKHIENLNFFPFVFDLECKFMDDEHSFYTYTLKGKEGYFLTQGKKNQITSNGIGSVAEIDSYFINLIPNASYQKRIISFINSEEVNKSFDIYKTTTNNQRAFLSLQDESWENNVNPVIAIYSLK